MRARVRPLGEEERGPTMRARPRRSARPASPTRSTRAYAGVDGGDFIRGRAPIGCSTPSRPVGAIAGSDARQRDKRSWCGETAGPSAGRRVIGRELRQGRRSAPRAGTDGGGRRGGSGLVGGPSGCLRICSLRYDAVAVSGLELKCCARRTGWLLSKVAADWTGSWSWLNWASGSVGTGSAER
jgi:hypothetical protein